MNLSDMIDRLLHFDLDDEVIGYAVELKTETQPSKFGLADDEGYETRQRILSDPAELNRVTVYGGAWPRQPIQ
jgi:hypothetical protein